MNYLSTRGTQQGTTFQEAVMAGLAPDGGLYLPESVPSPASTLEALSGRSFPEIFNSVVWPYVSGCLSQEDLEQLTARSYQRFTHPEITPVVDIDGIHVCELFHGPTYAFKDVALQFLGNLFEHFLARTGRRLTVLGATSGDTGSAAIQALRGKDRVEVFILFPHGRVSPMQELQMTTVADANVHALALHGSFDDAQAIVKDLFNDHGFNGRVGLGAVNSINWARVMAQITYFFYAYFRVVDSTGIKLGAPVRVAVPTGNFGHIYAGLLARRMGLPIERLILATNANDILYRFIETGEYSKSTVHHTFSPSMDIQIASNFERYLYDLSGRDSAQVSAWMKELGARGSFSVSGSLKEQVASDFAARRVDDEETIRTIAGVHGKTGYLLDPHSAIAYRAAQDYASDGVPVIAMATAHPAKFSEAINRAVGRDPELPDGLAGLAELPTRVDILEATPDAVRSYIEKKLKP
ncbi:MAG: threonine synthase [Deltaproteobacteria bacterium]|nr:threonine synthase [Deltaproteobacteria bacterium]